MNRDIDPAAIAGQMFVDRIIENLENAVVQTALIGVADIHAGAFPDGFQTLEWPSFGGVGRRAAAFFFLCGFFFFRFY